MKHLYKLTGYFSAALIGVSLLFAAAATLRAEPAFKHQPNVNKALKELTKAQSVVTTDSGKALEALQNAKAALERSSVGKGSYRVTAIRLTGQAITHLQKQETDVATKEINEAIDNVNKAGDVGAR